jgi:hypothetical protein
VENVMGCFGSEFNTKFKTSWKIYSVQIWNKNIRIELKVSFILCCHHIVENCHMKVFSPITAITNGNENQYKL